MSSIPSSRELLTWVRAVLWTLDQTVISARVYLDHAESIPLFLLRDFLRLPGMRDTPKELDNASCSSWTLVVFYTHLRRMNDGTRVHAMLGAPHGMCFLPWTARFERKALLRGFRASPILRELLILTASAEEPLASAMREQSIDATAWRLVCTRARNGGTIPEADLTSARVTLAELRAALLSSRVSASRRSDDARVAGGVRPIPGREGTSPALDPEAALAERFRLALLADEQARSKLGEESTVAERWEYLRDHGMGLGYALPTRETYARYVRQAKKQLARAECEDGERDGRGAVVSIRDI